MRITIKIALIFSALWISIKYLFFYTGITGHDRVPATLINVFLLLSAITVGLYLQKRRDTEDTNAMIDLKNAMSSGVIYSVIVSAFIYLYYTKIDPEFIAHQLAEREVEIHKMVNDEKRLAAFKKEHADAEIMTKDQIEKRLLKSNREGASAGFTSTLSTLALLILSAFYSILVTIIMRKVVFRES